MEISLISDTLTTVVTTQGLGFSKFLLNRSNVLSLSDSSSEQQISPSPAGVRQISAVIFPVDVLAPPPVKYNNVKTAPRRLARKTRRRTRRKSLGGGGADEGDENGFLFDYDGPFGGGGSSWNGGGSGGGAGGGRGWNFDGFGGANWEESSSNSFSDPAFDLVYELMCWVALSNCLHFAFKKVVRILADGFSDPARDKVPV
ncbi:uncharacterized protein [Nicotiana sylvestris]|uniref:ATP-dependent RNA helicase A n=1 Tax=Nicotiana sylvestris TaxID=4096 RepID=A0A1U7VWM8_NICSY|nr:PREDICTED: ATP-dependent RNA helicase A [Nicotiana sylvestris]XP_016451308.1 PREDICTED: ATP-dependent RNA helicase A-like [Nicotiana tabacum]